MTASGVFLSQPLLTSLSAIAQAEIQQAIFGPMKAESTASADTPPPVVSASSDVDTEGPPDLSPAQARKVVNGLSDRPAKALRFIAEQPKPQFFYPTMIEAVGPDSSGTLRGALSAITRRVRTVLGDLEVELIWYEDAGEEPNAYTGMVSAMTHTSLRKAFGIS